MKAFNNWWDNDITKEYPLYQDKNGYNIGNHGACKAGWKAALERVLFVYHNTALDIIEEINEELKEE